MEEVAAPDLIGLVPDDAARVSHGRGLEFVIDNVHDFVIDEVDSADVWGLSDQPCV